jgi:hypothetical protein
MDIEIHDSRTNNLKVRCADCGRDLELVRETPFVKTVTSGHQAGVVGDKVFCLYGAVFGRKITDFLAGNPIRAFKEGIGRVPLAGR